MSIEAKFGNLFKPEMKSSGSKLLAQEKISISSHSDTGIQAYARVTPPAKITLSSDGVASSSFTAACSCPVAKKNRFCKHVWATLLFVEDEYPDFLDAKTEIEKTDQEEPSEIESETVQNAYQKTAKARASEYRKAAYQKQKDWAKERKREKEEAENEAPRPSYPSEVEATLVYFSQNGFPMPKGPSRDILAEAKRKLSRIFHPDKGGSHEESVELNRNCEVLLNFLRD